MSELKYTYDGTKIGEKGKDRMRFELGDVMVADGPRNAYLSDEEIEAMIEAHSPSWLRAKVALVESVLRRFSYEVDTKSGSLQLWMSQRYKAWEAMYNKLKAEADGASSMPNDYGVLGASRPPYFYEGMHDNHGLIGGRRHVPPPR
ncbi:MAG: hypothetical protein IJ741_03655 [Schwartzia sp.]|nr:hypothetical protein [Schwartzia sp. (in: firmicutes)]